MDASTLPVLELRDYSVRFSTPDGEVAAVSSLDLSVGAGETLAVVGESGSGKSQTFNGVFGLLSRNGRATGAALIEGRDLLAMSEKGLDAIRGQDMAMVFQDPMTALNPAMKIRHQLSETLQVHKGMKRRDAESAALAMLRQVGIPEAERRFEQYPHQLSGGMRQRVVIAMALLCRPKLIVADEPTTALDVTIQAQILDLFRDLTAEFGTALVLITHDLGVVAGIATRVAVMYAGRVVEEAGVDALFARPAHPYTAALMRSIPRVDREIEAVDSIPGRPPDAMRPPPGCPFHPRCRHAEDRCRRERPPLGEVAPGRSAACWFPFVDAASGALTAESAHG
ncbi:ABC transporter ATP-binding protein [Aurantimonas endophytica]|uniref:Oligopeptide transport system ATP-binding protein n=1 Tax=Aurantimonas endophytica TaxID=1522175 RepID=A0A7W6MRJ8_9HYPH|nr:ABC transporter ATP-binding protein [Aurantimonas endophytica]MBB4005205.1 oligopeptide transport system ATP-binding protein [Aurantimonas endophytica]MCO6406132.1 ATP-binding cassette domain-containing protein [Aurantimonas endophytica]